jgi:hypothetical protein
MPVALLSELFAKAGVANIAKPTAAPAKIVVAIRIENLLRSQDQSERSKLSRGNFGDFLPEQM